MSSSQIFLKMDSSSLSMNLNSSKCNMFPSSLAHISKVGTASDFHICKISFFAIHIQNRIACVWFLLQELSTTPKSPILGSGSRFIEYASERNLNIFFRMVVIYCMPTKNETKFLLTHCTYYNMKRLLGISYEVLI